MPRDGGSIEACWQAARALLLGAALLIGIQGCHKPSLSLHPQTAKAIISRLATAASTVQHAAEARCVVQGESPQVSEIAATSCPICPAVGRARQAVFRHRMLPFGRSVGRDLQNASPRLQVPLQTCHIEIYKPSTCLLGAFMAFLAFSTYHASRWISLAASPDPSSGENSSLQASNWPTQPHL
ncbi:uncharacterized protein BDZ99DRAFT_10449 [Mytilinidion resinicola]|uniref:Uncharacterized protein n=1 Tax=Mytilinidion resinicola TaxID=574789 RepID=A0A6A6Z8W3_9PEZI|nr:uncharacterized protein BDZ99DRAFT_10449 [Mytilinidion resinicola]KAF2817173.1 hypothetical protein BDZ99DRAFT_10449 [Mytilinidion resinicola]